MMILAFLHLRKVVLFKFFNDSTVHLNLICNNYAVSNRGKARNVSHFLDKKSNRFFQLITFQILAIFLLKQTRYIFHIILRTSFSMSQCVIKISKTHINCSVLFDKMIRAFCICKILLNLRRIHCRL